MATFGPEEQPVVFETEKAQIRSAEADGTSVAFFRLPAGADGRPLLEDLPGGSIHCLHWGYVISGRLRIHTADGPHDVLAGQAFHVEPGHAPESVEDTEMFEVSPAPESREIGECLAEASRALQSGACTHIGLRAVTTPKAGAGQDAGGDGTATRR